MNREKRRTRPDWREAFRARLCATAYSRFLVTRHLARLGSFMLAGLCKSTFDDDDAVLMLMLGVYAGQAETRYADSLSDTYTFLWLGKEHLLACRAIGRRSAHHTPDDLLRDRRCHYRMYTCQDHAKSAKALALPSSVRQRILDFWHIISASAVLCTRLVPSSYLI